MVATSVAFLPVVPLGPRFFSSHFWKGSPGGTEGRLGDGMTPPHNTRLCVDLAFCSESQGAGRETTPSGLRRPLPDVLLLVSLQRVPGSGPVPCQPGEAELSLLPPLSPRLPEPRLWRLQTLCPPPTYFLPPSPCCSKTYTKAPLGLLSHGSCECTDLV